MDDVKPANDVKLPPVKKKRRRPKTIRPLYDMVLIESEEDENVTAGGIILPDTSKTHVVTGRIISVPQHMEENEYEFPFRNLDRIYYDVRYRFPCECTADNKRWFLDKKYIYGVIEEDEEYEDEKDTTIKVVETTDDEGGLGEGIDLEL